MILQDTTPRRRWFQFSLGAVFVAVTVASLLAWHFADYFRSYPFQIIGHLNAAEIREICAIVAEHPNKVGPILTIDVKSPKRVEIMTGENRGPLDGGGWFLELQKQNGTWTIVSDGFWVS